MEVPIPRFCPGGPIVILSQERGFLKSQELFGALREAVVRAGKKGQRLDEVEQEAQAETPQRSGLSDGWRERLRERRNAATARHTPSQRRLQTFQHQLLPEPSDFRPTCTELLDQLLVQVGRPPLTFVRMKQRFGPHCLSAAASSPPTPLAPRPSTEPHTFPLLDTWFRSLEKGSKKRSSPPSAIMC